MARLPRIVLPGYLHLVTHAAQRGRQVFASSNDRRRYLEALRDAAHEAGVAVHAYGLSGDEARMLATPSTPNGLASMLQGTNRRYVPFLNRSQGAAGTPWHGRFRSAVVDPSTHFRAALRFVESPAGHPDDVPPPGDVASVRHHLGLEAEPMLTEHPSFWTFGNTPFEREAAYARFRREAVDPQMATFLRAALGGWAVGGGEFLGAVEKAAKRRVVARPVGRPTRQ